MRVGAPWRSRGRRRERGPAPASGEVADLEEVAHAPHAPGLAREALGLGLLGLVVAAPREADHAVHGVDLDVERVELRARGELRLDARRHAGVVDLLAQRLLAAHAGVVGDLGDRKDGGSRAW